MGGLDWRLGRLDLQKGKSAIRYQLFGRLPSAICILQAQPTQARTADATSSVLRPGSFPIAGTAPEKPFPGDRRERRQALEGLGGRSPLEMVRVYSSRRNMTI
jgi:hypothetical protein